MCREDPKLKVTVITVSYNAESCIEKTITSVLNQSYPDIEYIVIDGGSTDGTMPIVRKYEEQICQVVSEPDNGIYDAMNKGVDRASGDWIIFMNCGDSFYDDSVVLSMCDMLNKNEADVLYGRTNVLDSIGQYILTPRPLEDFDNMIMPFFHQSSAVRTDVLRKSRFDLRFKLCADYCFFRTCYMNGSRFLELPFVISNYDISDGSQSFYNGWKVYRESHEIVGRKNMTSFFSFIYLECKYSAKTALYRCLPEHCSTALKRKVVENNKYLISKSW